MDAFSIIFIIAMFGILYFLILRPQMKRQKAQKELMSSLNKGDEIVTVGGMIGTLTKVDDDFVKVQLANNIEIRMQKNAVQATLPKGTLKGLDAK